MIIFKCVLHIYDNVHLICIVSNYIVNCDNVKMATISVFVRIRPMLNAEMESNQQPERRIVIAPNKK